MLRPYRSHHDRSGYCRCTIVKEGTAAEAIRHGSLRLAVILPTVTAGIFWESWAPENFWGPGRGAGPRVSPPFFFFPHPARKSYFFGRFGAVCAPVGPGGFL